MVLERLYTDVTVNFVFYTEINRVRNELFHGVVKNAEVDGMFTELQLPTPSGPRVKLSEKVYAPVKEYPKVRLPAYMHGNCVITKLSFSVGLFMQHCHLIRSKQASASDTI